MNNVLVIGSINMDLVIKAEKFPESGETVMGCGFAEIPGGKGANQAIAASMAGAKVCMLGSVGNDRYGEILTKNLKKHGIDCSAVIRKNCNSGIASITVADGENRIVINPGANNEITKEDIHRYAYLIEWADMVVFQLEIPQEVILEAMVIAKKKDTRIVLNCAPMQKIDPEILELTDIIIPNEHEASMLISSEMSSMEMQEEAVRNICRKGISQTIITLGSKGCIYNYGSDVKRYPAYKVNAVDTTAAGDTFIGAFCAKYTGDDSLSDAIQYGTAASAIAVGRFGASVSIPHKNEISEFIKIRGGEQ